MSAGTLVRLVRVIGIVVAVPVAEELIFRGAMLALTSATGCSMGSLARRPATSWCR
jgi:hypothetical protein